MWHHKAEQEIASRFMECNGSLPSAAPIDNREDPQPREERAA
jgi:hypothetical protein